MIITDRWVGQTRILVYLVVPRKADLSNIRFADFLAHFNGDKDNAMLFVGTHLRPIFVPCMLLDATNGAYDDMI